MFLISFQKFVEDQLILRTLRFLMPFDVVKSDPALKYVSKISDRVTAVDSGLRPDPPDLLVLLGLRHGKVRLQDRHPGLLLRLPCHHDRPSDSDWTHHRMRTQE